MALLIIDGAVFTGYLAIPAVLLFRSYSRLT